MPLQLCVSPFPRRRFAVVYPLFFLATLVPTASVAQVKMLATPHTLVGANPRTLAAADLNGDGKADLVVANSNDSTVSVLLSNGDGIFHTAVNYVVGADPANVAIADFNGDGKVDLAVSTTGAKEVSVLLGNGDGTFQSAVTYATSDYTLAVATGDFNGDGKLDIAAANASGNVDILPGNGDGTFGPSHKLTTPASPSALVGGDFNHDGKADLAVAINGSSSSTVNIYLGNGDGTFTAGATYSFPKNLMQIAAADLNADGKLDLAVTDSGVAHGSTASMSVMLGNGDGTFAAAVNYPALPNPFGVAVADVNGDGKPDLVETDSVTDVIHIWLGNGDGTFSSSLEYAAGLMPGGIATGDFNGDGKIDLASANSGSNDVSILVGNGDGSFRGARVFELGTISAAVNLGTLVTPTAVLGDFNGDGKLDFALGSSGVLLALGNGDGTLQAPVSLGVAQGQVVGPILAADLNKDGHLDLVALAVLNLAPETGIAAVLLGNGNGTFVPSNIQLMADNGPSAIAAADFNSDGNLDLIVASSGESSNSRTDTLLGDGSGGFQVKTFVGIDSFNAVVTADFNGDGKPDVMGFNATNGLLLLGLGKGDGTFTGSTLPYTLSTTVTPSSTSIATGDFNGDGFPDVAVVNNVTSGSVSVLLGNGDGTFQAPVNYAAGTNPQSIAIADIDKDGHPDLIVAGASTLAILLGNADGTFQNTVVLSAPGQTVSVAVGDLDGDGYNDVLVSNTAGNAPNTLGTAVVFLNRTGIVLTGTSTALSSSSNPALTGQSITLTVTVTPASGISVPTGSVTFLDGSTNLGTVALSGNAATFTTSTLSAGSHLLTASYSGDSTFNGSSSSTLTQIINATPFIITATGSTDAAVNPGSTATYQLMLTPGMASSQSVTMTCSGTPKNSTCGASPSPVTLRGSTPTGVTVTVQTTGSAATLVPSRFPKDSMRSARGNRLGPISVLFAGLLWMGGRRRPRRAALCLLLGTLLLLAGCGGSGNGEDGGSSGTPAGTYTLNVTATSSAGTQMLQLKLTVN